MDAGFTMLAPGGGGGGGKLSRWDELARAAPFLVGVPAVAAVGDIGGGGGAPLGLLLGEPAGLL